MIKFLVFINNDLLKPIKDTTVNILEIGIGDFEEKNEENTSQKQ